MYSLRKRLAVVIVGVSATAIVPALPVQAAPSGGCPSPSNAPVLTLSSSPSAVKATKAETSSGAFTQNGCGIKNATIRLQRRALLSGKPSGSWSTFAKVTTGANGAFTTTRKPLANEQQRAVFTKAGGYPSTTSAAIGVHVATHVSVSSSLLSACRVELVGKTTPAKANRKIKIQSRGPRGSFTGWTTIGTFHTKSDGSYLTIGTLSCGKTYNLAVYISGDASNTAGRSRTIFGIKPHH